VFLSDIFPDWALPDILGVLYYSFAVSPPYKFCLPEVVAPFSCVGIIHLLSYPDTSEFQPFLDTINFIKYYGIR